MSLIRLGNLLWKDNTQPISEQNPIDTKEANSAAIKTVVDDLKSELLLVKSDLAAIKANQISGEQKVQLSGTIVELVHTATANKDTGNGGAGQLTYLGQTPSKTILGLNPIDLRQYNEVSYFCINYTNTEVTFKAIGVWQLGLNPVPNGRHVGVVMQSVKVAAGALKPISKDEFPLLKEKLVGIYFEVVPTGDITNTGFMTVKLIGSKI